MELSEIKQIFEAEFGDLWDKFIVHDVTLEEARFSKEKSICNPGVYIFWRAGEIIKVGRAQNPRKRAREHIRDNTGGIMGGLYNDPSLRLFLFNVLNTRDCHWAAHSKSFLKKT